MTEDICVCVMAFQSTRLSMGCGSKNLVNGYYLVVYFCCLGNVLTVICTENTCYLCKYCLSFNQYLLFHSLPLFLPISLFPKISLTPSLSLYVSSHRSRSISLSTNLSFSLLSQRICSRKRNASNDSRANIDT